jgi:excisionase family DNA binding protein
MTPRIQAALEELVAALAQEFEASAKRAGPERLLSINEASKALSIGRSALYSGPIASGQLRTVKVGRRRLVPSSQVSEYIAKAAR